jgi:hypothetical protein
MEIDFDQVELGLVVNLTILREVLKSLSIDGKRWWIASDPQDALTTRSITIGHGDPRCTDRLNTLYFRIPVLGNETPRGGTDDSCCCLPRPLLLRRNRATTSRTVELWRISWKISLASTGQLRAH